jgi:NADH-quinone oxidoreductase subunit N
VVLRVLYTAFGDAASSYIEMTKDWSGMVAILAAATMTTGNLLALSQKNLKRLLGYSTVAHAGYMLAGVAAVLANARNNEGAAGPQGVLYYLAGYAFTNLAVFFAFIAVTVRSGNELVSGLAGLGKRSPLAAALLTLGLLSLLGIPPTVGFMAKVFVFSAAVNSGLIWLAVLGVINTVISAFFYLNIVRSMYFDDATDSAPLPADRPALIASAIAAAGVAVFGIAPWLILNIAGESLTILPAASSTIAGR